jgi:uncharacterized protein with FMN-binding domain
VTREDHVRRIIIAIGATVSGIVLLFSWPTSTNQQVASSGTAVATGGTSGSDGSTDSDGSTSGGSTSDQTTTDAVTATYDGAAASTRYGDVQVRITVTDGVVTDATAIAYPNGDRHDQQINAYAIPILEAATVEAQSADLDMVSGATVTSRGYVASLQDALDQAGL